MKYLDALNTRWQHENRSGNIDDPFYKQWVDDGNLIDPADPPPPPPTNAEIYDQTMQNQKALKAFALCINDGSIVPGADITPTALKAIVVTKMESL